MRQIILDTETTGLEPKEGHRIIEFAGLEMVDRRLTGKHLHLYIHPQREIDAGAQDVHGISLESLEGKPVFAQVADEIVEFLRDAELIIHNAPFDVGFLNHEFAMAGKPAIKDICANVVDTLKEARTLYPGKKNSLDALCDRFEIDRSNRTLHGALIDCELLSEVYLTMTRGQHTLDMDGADHGSIDGETTQQFERPEHLRVLRASEEELLLHQNYLTILDKASDGATLYRGQE